MLDGISQSLVNMTSKFGKGDLDKGVVFDTQTGKFAVNRNADQMGLGDHNYFQNETPTELGRQNAIIRSALANSLKKILSEGRRPWTRFLRRCSVRRTQPATSGRTWKSTVRLRRGR